MITGSVPELTPLTGLNLRMMLDGELIVGSGRMADFYRLAGRLSGQRQWGDDERVKFVAFDVLWLDGEEITGLGYAQRREVLEGLQLPSELVTVVPRYPGRDAGDLLAGCESLGMEGIVAKRLGAPYRPGRRSLDWRKVKISAWADHWPRRSPRRTAAA